MAKDPVCGMHVNEKNALMVSVSGKKYYFCSERCMHKFAKEKGLDEEKICPECVAARKKLPFYKMRLFQVLVVFFAMLIATYLVPAFSDFRFAVFDYLKILWWAIILGMVLGGVIDYYIPQKYISRHLARGEKRTVFYAVILGFMMSACSHGILAISMELYKKGASAPAVVAFLMASPWANLPITILLVGLFGLKALWFIGIAIVIAIISGLIFQGFAAKGWLEKSPYTVETEKEFSVRKDVRKRLNAYTFSWGGLKKDLKGVAEGSWALTKMVMWWILIGVIFAGIARAFIPSHLFMTYMGPTLLGLLITLGFATVIEVCSEGSAPLAFEIFNQTGAFGNAFAFLMAGVATDYTEIGLIYSNIGKRTAFLLPIVAVPQIVVLGYLFNILL